MPVRPRGAIVDNDWTVVEEDESQNPVQRPVRHQMMAAAAAAARGRNRERRGSTMQAPTGEELEKGEEPACGRGLVKKGTILGAPVAEELEDDAE